MADRDNERPQRPPRNPAYFSAVANALFPHLTDPSTYGEQPPPSMQPNPVGKVPEVQSDPRQQGALADIGNALTFAIPFGGPAAGAAKLTAAALPLAIARRALPEAEGIAVKGAHAYHSSPYDFKKFSMAKIGSGEGAQAFGHGIYSAESPAVSGRGGQYWQQFMSRFSGPEADAAEILRANNFNRDHAIAEIRRTSDVPNDAYSQEMLQLLESGKPVGPRTYVIDIKTPPETLLNWDRPLREQSAEVQSFPGMLDAARREAANRIRISQMSGRPMSPKRTEELGGIISDPLSAPGYLGYYGLMNQRALQFGRTDVAAPKLAREFSEAGIPGIQYLDAYSRLAAPGEPVTHNFVRFDPNIDILKKLGLVGTLGAGLTAGAAGGTMGDTAQPYNPDDNL